MRLINTTAIPNRIIHYFMRDLGIFKAHYHLTVSMGDCSGRGTCIKYDDGTIHVILAQLSISTLAHELKHVEQHVSGLSDWMETERELTPYQDRWHEIEARLYAQSWADKHL